MTSQWIAKFDEDNDHMSCLGHEEAGSQLLRCPTDEELPSPNFIVGTENSVAQAMCCSALVCGVPAFRTSLNPPFDEIHLP